MIRLTDTTSIFNNSTNSLPSGAPGCIVGFELLRHYFFCVECCWPLFVFSLFCLFSLNHCILRLHWLLPSDYPCYLQTLPIEDDGKKSQTICSHEIGIETRCSGGVSISIFINDSCGECLISNNSNTTDAISWAGTAFPSGAPEFNPGFSKVRATWSLVLCVIFCKSLFVLFRLAIVLSALLLFTDADYPFGIYKLFFKCKLAGILKFILETCLQSVDTLGFHINQET